MEDPDDTWDYNNHPIGVVWTLFDPATGTPGNATQTFYVGVGQNGPGLPNVYRTTDGGVTFEPLPGAPVSSVDGDIVTMTGGTTWDMSAVGDDGSRQWESTGLLPINGELDAEGTLYITYWTSPGPTSATLATPASSAGSTWAPTASASSTVIYCRCYSELTARRTPAASPARSSGCRTPRTGCGRRRSSGDGCREPWRR